MSTGGGIWVSTTSTPRTTNPGTKFPYGDFKNVHRCGVIAAEMRAAQQKYTDIEVAEAHLHAMLDNLM